MDAAARALATRGYTGATTMVMAAAAGVSQGALFKHFPTKAHLLAACVERILGGFFDSFRADLERGPARSTYAATLPERIRPAVAALWRIFRRHEMQAVMEVYVAARTDPPLGAALGPILDRHRLRILGEARRLYPELAALADFDMIVDSLVYAMQGVILGVFSPDGASDATHLAFFERLALRELQSVVDGARA